MTDIDKQLLKIVGHNAFYNPLDEFQVDSDVQRLVKAVRYLVTQIRQVEAYAKEHDDSNEYLSDILEKTAEILA
jgi:hypothetical protein